MGSLFLAEDGRLRPTARVILYVLPFALITVVGTLAQTGTPQPNPAASDAPRLLGPIGVVVIAVTVGLSVLYTWFFRRFFDRRPLVTLGLDLRAGALRELALGFAVGAVLMAGIAIVEIGTGWYRVDGITPLDAVFHDLLFGLLIFSGVGFYEELVTRGYILQNLGESWGLVLATLVSSAIFAVLHAGNPGSGLTPVLGIFVAGILLAAGYLATSRLWLPIGLHWSWNFFQGPVFGFPVSGTQASGILRLTPVGPEPMTGGAFGPEASLVGVAACLIGTAVLLRARRSPRRDPATGVTPSPTRRGAP